VVRWFSGSGVVAWRSGQVAVVLGSRGGADWGGNSSNAWERRRRDKEARLVLSCLKYIHIYMWLKFRLHKVPFGKLKLIAKLGH